MVSCTVLLLILHDTELLCLSLSACLYVMRSLYGITVSRYRFYILLSHVPSKDILHDIVIDPLIPVGWKTICYFSHHLIGYFWTYSRVYEVSAKLTFVSCCIRSFSRPDVLPSHWKSTNVISYDQACYQSIKFAGTLLPIFLIIEKSIDKMSLVHFHLKIFDTGTFASCRK